MSQSGVSPEFGARTAALGIDIGGTSVRIAVVGEDGRIHASRRVPTPAQGEPAALARLVADETAAVLAELPEAARASQDTGELRSPIAPNRPDVSPAGRTMVCRAVGVALPGIWDSHHIMRCAFHLPKLVGTNLLEFFRSALGRLARLESDVNAAGWAQWRAISPPPGRFVYLSLGTGVGGCAIVDGALIRHTDGGAGHFGFLIVDPRADAPVGRGGIRGSLEAVVRDVLDQASSAGDEEIARKLAQPLALGLAQLVHLYAPDCIALGGGVTDRHSDLVDAAADMLRGSRWLGPAECPSVVRAPLTTDEAGVTGAALLALQPREP